MTNPVDMTTLANVKAWRSPPLTTTADDAQISRVITAASRAILAHLQRSSILSVQYNELRDSFGANYVVPREWPVTSIQSLMSYSQTIPAATSFHAPGYWLEPWDGYSAGRQQKLIVRSYGLARGTGVISVAYTAGYLVSGEAQMVPGSASGSNGYQVVTDRIWGADKGVTYANGTAMVAVAANPAVGQYVPPSGLGAPYVFSSADAGAAILVTYSYVPEDIVQACTELVILRVNQRNRIGVNSENIKGMNVSYAKEPMPPSVVDALVNYARIFPS